MQPRIMITNGGPHSPETLADWTTSQLIDVAAAIDAGMSHKEALEFRARLMALMAERHRTAQAGERAALELEGPDRLTKPMPTNDHVRDAADAILAIVNLCRDDGTPVFSTIMRDHFARPEARGALERMLREHFHENIKIERSYHALAREDHPVAKAFIAVQQDGHAHLIRDEHDPEIVMAILSNSVPPHSAG